MKVTVERSALTSAVAFASRAIPRNAALPVLQGLKFEVTGEALRASAFDFDLYAEEVIPCAEAGRVSFLIPGRLMAQYLGGMSGTSVTLEVETSQVTMTCGEARVTMQRLALEDYPAAPKAPAVSVTADAEALAAALATAREVIDPNSPVQALRGLDLHLNAPTLTVAGVHDQRVAVRRIACEGEGEARVIVPANVADAARTLTGEVSIGVDEGTLSLADGPRRIVTRLLMAAPSKYPELLARHTGETRLTLDRAALIEAVKWVILGDTRKVAHGHHVWDIGTDSVRLGLSGAEGVDAETSIPAKLDGEPFTMGWRAENLLRGMAATTAETITMHIGAVTRSVLITADDDEAFTFLAQPVVLK